ncbi:MAG: flagellar export chaperone FlgN [Sedimentisphaerales bacterium]|nr:flagellar export chaperone FlgN [Sedimentisphaerales bacterium]
MASIPTPAKVEALLAALDEDIRHAKASLVLLDTLRSLLIKRDETALEALLQDLRREGEVHAENERRREGIRRQLAEELHCGVGQVTLSALKDKLSGERQMAVLERQRRLKSLTADLKREFTLTAVLVADCARFNRSLMRVIFGLEAKGNMTYGANGAARRQAAAALVNVHY